MRKLTEKKTEPCNHRILLCVIFTLDKTHILPNLSRSK